MAKFGLQDLADILVSKGGISYEEANDFVTSFFGLIQEGIELDEIVKIKGLGTFKLVTVEARESVNVNTGERVLIDSHGKVTFSPDATMKDIVNKPFSGFETVILNEGVTFDDMEPVIATEAEIESEESDESDVNNDTESDVVDKEKNELIATQDEAQDFMIEIAEEDNIETSDVVEQESVLTDAADDITREDTPLDDKDEIISTGDTNTNQDVCVNNEEAVSEKAVSEEAVSEEVVSDETVSEDVVSEKGAFACPSVAPGPDHRFNDRCAYHYRGCTCSVGTRFPWHRHGNREEAGRGRRIVRCHGRVSGLAQA
jgi:nucleoid DNA-binding protein